ncbi:glutaredoxin-like protein [Roseivivax marinus]|uniref:Glutaredoxin-like protein n=1 Tax=Roseivivax marinus TaxID=1379903 RepID=W4HMN1_9RHOB|nr:ArsC/Spx/MgsR family protein [Roseivivax marinus]ETW13959.1 glutaredoxin-like protein [Roseivivax marinus]
MIVYGLKNCDTCRAARKALPGADFVDVSVDGLPAEVRDRALATFGSGLVNTRSTTWRGLSDEDRAAAPEDLLTAHPKLMKRPLIAQGETLYLGWTEATRTALGV